MKKIHTETNGNRTTKVYRDSEWDEFCVRLYIDDRLQTDTDYHTADKEDAIGTARTMVRQGDTAHKERDEFVQHGTGPIADMFGTAKRKEFTPHFNYRGNDKKKIEGTFGEGVMGFIVTDNGLQIDGDITNVTPKWNHYHVMWTRAMDWHNRNVAVAPLLAHDQEFYGCSSCRNETAKRV